MMVWAVVVISFEHPTLDAAARQYFTVGRFNSILQKKKTYKFRSK